MNIRNLKIGDKIMNSHSKKVCTITNIEKVLLGKNDAKVNHTMVFTLEGLEHNKSSRWNQYLLLSHWELVK